MIISRRTKIALEALAVLVGTWLVAPTLVVIPISFTGTSSLAFPIRSWSTQWYHSFFADTAWMEALSLSLRLGLCVALVSTVVGTAAALGLRRFGGTRGRSFVRGLLMTPLIVPGIALAIGVYALFLRMQLTGTFIGFVLAHSVLGVPYVVITVGAALESFNPQLLHASASLGAGPMRSFLRVTLPLIAPGVLAGVLFSFVASFDEVVMALFISGPYTKTLPIVMFESITRDSDPTVAAASTLILGVSVLLITASLVYAARRNRRLA